jgi:WXXGXW repeat (2 copies)
MDSVSQVHLQMRTSRPKKTAIWKMRGGTMKRIWMTVLMITGGFDSAMFGQQYPQQNPQQYPPFQGTPSNNGQYGNGQYDNGEYATDPGYRAYSDPAYNGSYQGVYAPAPPPMPSYAYQRPPMPGPGYYWVDGYWNLVGGRYSWVGGYWMLPPYAGGYWVRPRYSGGRFFLGFWGGGRRDFDRGFAGNGYRYQGRAQAPRQSYGPPAQSRFGFRGGDNRGDRPGNRQRGRR